MADADEDLPQPAESNPPEDTELDDEVPDFRLLSNFLYEALSDTQEYHEASCAKFCRGKG